MVLFLERCIIVSRYLMGPTSKNIEALRMLCEENRAHLKSILKPVVCFIALFFAISFSCLASDKPYDLKDFNFGIKLGATQLPSQMVYPDGAGSLNSDPNIGFAGGLSANYYFIKNLFAVQIEVNYVNINSKISLINDDNISDAWNIIETPLLLKVSSSPDNYPLKPYIILGPAMELQFLFHEDGLNSPTINYSNVLLRGSLIAGIGADYILDNGNAVSLEVRADWKLAGQVKGYQEVLPYTFLTAFVGYSI